MHSPPLFILSVFLVARKVCAFTCSQVYVDLLGSESFAIYTPLQNNHIFDKASNETIEGRPVWVNENLPRFKLLWNDGGWEFHRASTMLAFSLTESSNQPPFMVAPFDWDCWKGNNFESCDRLQITCTTGNLEYDTNPDLPGNIDPMYTGEFEHTTSQLFVAGTNGRITAPNFETNENQKIVYARTKSEVDEKMSVETMVFIDQYKFLAILSRQLELENFQDLTIFDVNGTKISTLLTLKGGQLYGLELFGDTVLVGPDRVGIHRMHLDGTYTGIMRGSEGMNIYGLKKTSEDSFLIIDFDSVIHSCLSGRGIHDCPGLKQDVLDLLPWMYENSLDSTWIESVAYLRPEYNEGREEFLALVYTVGIDYYKDFILKCSLTELNKCSIFYDFVANNNLVSSGCLLTVHKNLVFLADLVTSQIFFSNYNGMKYFELMPSYDKSYFMPGDIGLPRTIAVRPGFFPPMSIIELASNATTVDDIIKSQAGSTIRFRLSFVDDRNVEIDFEKFPELTIDPDRLVVEATGNIELFNGKTATINLASVRVVFDGDENNYYVEIDVTAGGRWEMHVKERTGVITNPFSNSPVMVDVKPDVVSAGSSRVDVCANLRRYDVCASKLELKDNYNNLVHQKDGLAKVLLVWWWDDGRGYEGRVTTTIDERLEFNITEDGMGLDEGTNFVHVGIVRGGRVEELANSPLPLEIIRNLSEMPGLAFIILIVAIFFTVFQLLVTCFFLLYLGHFRNKNFITRHSRMNNLFCLFSTLDFFLDNYFTYQVFKQGYLSFGYASLYLTAINCICNAIGQVLVLRHERVNKNVDYEEWESNQWFVGCIHIISLNQISNMKYLPYKSSHYYGYGSRLSYGVGTIAPLMTENAPQIIIQSLFIVESGQFEFFQFVSIVMTGLSIFLTLFTRVSVLFALQGRRIQQGRNTKPQRSIQHSRTTFREKISHLGGKLGLQLGNKIVPKTEKNQYEESRKLGENLVSQRKRSIIKQSVELYRDAAEYLAGANYISKEESEQLSIENLLSTLEEEEEADSKGERYNKGLGFVSKKEIYLLKRNKTDLLFELMDLQMEMNDLIKLFSLIREKMKEETLFNETVEKCLSELELGTESPLGTSADATPPLKTSGLPAGSPGLSQIKRRVTAGSLSPLPQTRSSLGTTARIRVLNLQASQDIGAVSEEGEG